MAGKLLCLVCLFLSDLLALGLWVTILPWAEGTSWAGPAWTWNSWVLAVGTAVLWIICLAREGLYVRRHTLAAEARHLFRASLFTLLWVLALAHGLPSPGSSPTSLAIAAHLPLSAPLILTALLLPITAGLFRKFIKSALYIAGPWKKDVLILGVGETGQRLIRSLAMDRFRGLTVHAALDEDRSLHGKRVLNVPVLGGLDALDPVLGGSSGRPFGDLLIALPDLPRDRLQNIITQAEGRVESIRFVPDLLGLSTLGVELESFQGTPAIRLNQNLMKPWNAAFKRLLDCILASLLGLLSLPLVVLIAFLIRRDSPGPALIPQIRLGKHGVPFQFLKFRTMYEDSDRRLEEALESEDVLRHEWQTFAKIRGRDPRVTPLGCFLRRTSLDELPQFWNILRGDMSLIGPRPFLPREAALMGTSRSVIASARPGLTGLWQVSGRNERTFQERLTLDEFYVRNWTVGMDLWVLVRTVGAMISGRGAF